MFLRSLSALFVLPSLIHAQAKPNLDGTWTYQPGAAPANLPAAPSGVLGTRLGLEVNGNTLIMRRPVRDRTVESRFPLDGTRTATRVPGRLCEGESQLHESATWDGDALVFAVTGQTPAGSQEIRQGGPRRFIRLEGPDRLVVEGTMSQGGQSRQVGSVYVRASEPLPPPPSVTAAGVGATIGQMAWLGTTWIGTTGTVTTEERWTPAASGSMMATARTLRSNALASFEFLCIVEREGSLVYVAMPDGRTTPTFFTLSAISDTSATFENPSHDYPRIIRYVTSADRSTLQTTIAGANGARAQTVSLRRQAP